MAPPVTTRALQRGGLGARRALGGLSGRCRGRGEPLLTARERR